MVHKSEAAAIPLISLSIVAPTSITTRGMARLVQFQGWGQTRAKALPRKRKVSSILPSRGAARPLELRKEARER